MFRPTLIGINCQKATTLTNFEILGAPVLTFVDHCQNFRNIVVLDHIFNFFNFGAPVPTPTPITAKRGTRVHAYMPNFVRIRLLCRLWVAKNSKFRRIFNVNILWWRHLAA